ncbi:hypothetical protein TNCV_2374521 [Trichonephila clavipes]|nr:hypothetical protein TNCV_2374521 [Trichonephila clavipes]
MREKVSEEMREKESDEMREKESDEMREKESDEMREKESDEMREKESEEMREKENISSVYVSENFQVPNIDTTLRSVATAQSCGIRQGFKKCSCKKNV